MGDIAIRIENLSKAYRIGSREKAHDTMGATLVSMVKSPFKNFSKVRSLSYFSDYEQDDVFWALKDISFEVRHGAVMGVIGKNGAGKSTLLKILSRITKPTRGQVSIYGRVASLLEVGTGFNPELTGRENVYLNGTILGMTRHEINAKLDQIVDFSGVEKFLDTPVKRYSSGMKVRLAFSVAAHLDPEILIIDEVLAVGDMAFQQKCLGKLDEVSKGGRTVLFVSHNMAAVEGMCQQAVVLNGGKKEYLGAVDDAVQIYKESMLTLAKNNFKDRDDRQGNGWFRFLDVAFNTGMPLRIGEEVSFEINYQAEEDLKDLHIAVTLCRNFEERLMVIDNKVQGKMLDVSKGKGTLKIVLPKMQLLPNNYLINLWAEHNNQVTDYLLNAASVQVMDKDVYNSGNSLNPQKHGFVFPDLCDWSIQ
jgi:lipopolysaccharide transport system ATP-binding protein